MTQFVIKPTGIIIFGATGDLANRKLIPALYNLYIEDRLKEDFFIVGASRSNLTNTEFKESIYKGVAEFSRNSPDKEKWKSFARKVFYLKVDAYDSDTFIDLKEKIKDLSADKISNFLYYFALSPEIFEPVLANLKKQQLVDNKNFESRVIVEKPFGSDFESSKELNMKLGSHIPEKDLFRIDHYLGKETVQNILVFRFANGIFEHIWNHKYIDYITINLSETVGLQDRASFFEKSGILRDIVQNHLLQVLSLLCIEPPLSIYDANSIRDEKVKVLKSLKIYQESEVYKRVVRGQYVSGVVNGKRVRAYRDIKDVNPNSMTETYVAMQVMIDNWRWHGVPIYIRTGKRLQKKLTEINVFFKQAPSSLFKNSETEIKLPRNALNIRVQPDEGTSLFMSSKVPGSGFDFKTVEMDFNYHSSFDTPSADAYERLILDAIKGDATLFIRKDEIEEAWKFLDPIFNAWNAEMSPPLYFYSAGGIGPFEANDILDQKHSWTIKS